MKKIGLVVATKTEFEVIFENKNLKYEDIETLPFNIKKLIINEKEIYVILAGVGEIYASIATQYIISKYNVELILNYGVVGSLRDDLDLKTVILVNKIFDYELDITALGEKRGYREELKDTFIYPNKEILEKVSSYFPMLQKVSCASGNKFISDSKEKESLFNEFGCSICEMEAAGICLTALKNNVPSLFIKGVSDSKTGGAIEFNKMIKESSSVAFDILIKITEIL